MRIYITFILAIVILASCSGKTKSQDENVYTLYRNSPYLQETQGANLDPKWNRVHIATFDAQEKDARYNSSLCDKVANFFNNEWREASETRPEHFSNFWCEKGRYKAIK